MLLHLRYDGRSLDMPLGSLDLGQHSSDREIKVAVANRLSESSQKFEHFVIDRNRSTGDITVRPQAVFG